MFVGHGLLAFAAVASVAARRWETGRAVRVGIVAALFATLPDADILFALAGPLSAPGGGVEAFWAASEGVHRSVTHSLVVGAVLALAAGAWRTRRPVARSGAILAMAGLLAAAWAVDGPPAAALLVPVTIGTLAVTTVARRWCLGPRVVLATAAAGLLSHPFGDLLAGDPPALLYPAGFDVLNARVMLHPDPTVHLLAAFFIELAIVWAALAVLLNLRGDHLRDQIHPRAAAGVAYAGAVFVVPAPTVDLAPPFVFSVLAVGAVGLPVHSAPGWLRPAIPETPPAGQMLSWLTTALAAVTVAALAYTGAYLLI